MKRVFEEVVGKAKLVIVREGERYVGIVWNGGEKAETVEHAQLEVLKAALRNIAGRLHPDYHGIDDAKIRFRSFFPLGFSDPAYLASERDYKDKARSALLAAIPLDRAIGADARDALACRKGMGTNLLSRFESARLSEVLASPEGPAFVQAAAAFTVEPAPGNLLAMEKAIKPHGPASWPLVTYLPFLWSPDAHMFLKPEATRDYAVRVGHGFATAYEAALEFEVYLALADLAGWTKERISDLAPRDRIDVQSFIWVVGSYTDADRPGAPQ